MDFVTLTIGEVDALRDTYEAYLFPNRGTKYVNRDDLLSAFRKLGVCDEACV